MPPTPGASKIPSHGRRIVLYQQTHHDQGQPVSLLPLVTGQNGGPPALTHLILATVHIHGEGSGPSRTSPFVRLNDHPPNHPRFTQLWDEVSVLQDSGVKVMCMIGGAAQGSFRHLDYESSELPHCLRLAELDSSGQRQLTSPRKFEASYAPLRNFICEHNLDGIDLDIEERMSLQGIVHLIDRLRSDFGPSSRLDRRKGFLISLAPVATALLRGYNHMSGFDYFELRRLRGEDIDWYNVQFYNGWGSLHDRFSLPQSGRELIPSSGATRNRSNFNSPSDGGNIYDAIIRVYGWQPAKVLVGQLTNPRHGGSGYVQWDIVARELGGLLDRYQDFGGVMGWEYWCAIPELETVQIASKASDKSRSTKGRQSAGINDDVHSDTEPETCYWRWPWRMKWIFALEEIRNRATTVAAGQDLAALRAP